MACTKMIDIRRGNVLNMTQRHGLVVVTSAWVDDDEFEWDWLANLDSIERVPFEEWCN